MASCFNIRSCSGGMSSNFFAEDKWKEALMTPQDLADALVRPRRLLEPDWREPDNVLEAGDGSVAVSVRGSVTAARRALLIHGWETDHRDLETIAEALSRRGVLCVMPDLPAHGASSGHSMTIPEGAAAVVAVAKRYEPFDLCLGYSMGAAVLLYAIGQGLRSGRTAFLVPPINYVDELKRSARGAGAPDPLIDAALQKLTLRCADLHAIDSAAMADHLTMPGLIAVAGNDQVVDPDNGRTLAALWPGCRLIEVADASHRSILRHDAIIEAICDLAAEPNAVAASAR